jgi:hypothetical protein
MISVCAEEQSTASKGGDRFELSASMSAKAQLSRGEVNQASLGMGSLTQQKPITRVPLIATMPPKQLLPKEDQPGAFMQEYNVDWSKWVSNHADSWFQVLRTAEYALGVQFQTPNAALIQFTCYADGTIGNVVLKQSSGVPAYDRLQIEALLAAVPTAPFPPGTKRRSITLIQGWESHPKRPGEEDFQLGSFGKDFPSEKVQQWLERR